MKLYAEVPYHRTRQIVLDVTVLLWCIVWVRIGMWINTLFNRLQGPGRAIEDAGSGLAGNFNSISERVGGVPLVGDTLQAPFEAAAGASSVLQQAGQSHQEVIHTLALWLGILFAVIPIGYVLLRYLPSRLRWIREASAASKLRIDAEDLRLFAIRAVATRPLYELRRACSDPAGCLARGEYEPLAALELGALGLEPRPAGRLGAGHP
jgi:hypothetical protein